MLFTYVGGQNMTKLDFFNGFLRFRVRGVSKKKKFFFDFGYLRSPMGPSSLPPFTQRPLAYLQAETPKHNLRSPNSTHSDLKKEPIFTKKLLGLAEIHHFKGAG